MCKVENIDRQPMVIGIHVEYQEIVVALGKLLLGDVDLFIGGEVEDGDVAGQHHIMQHIVILIVFGVVYIFMEGMLPAKIKRMLDYAVVNGYLTREGEYVFGTQNNAGDQRGISARR